MVDSKRVWTLIIISLLMFQLSASIFFKFTALTPFHLAYAKGSSVSVDLSAIPSELTTGNVVTITLICPSTSVSPTTGNTVALAHASHDTAFTEVITPLEVQLVKTNSSNFEKAGYIWTWHKSDGIALTDGRVKFEAQYPVGGAGVEAYQWHPSNPDYPIADEFPSTSIEGKYQVVAQCFYGLGTPDGHALSAPDKEFTVSTEMPEPALIADFKIVNEEGTRLSHLVVGSKVLIQGSITNLREEKQSLVYVVQIKDKNGFTESLSWTTDELSEGLIVDHSWTPEEEGTYTIEVFVWDNLDKPKPLASMLKRTIICYS